jgi:hypothetical protein
MPIEDIDEKLHKLWVEIHTHIDNEFEEFDKRITAIEDSIKDLYKQIVQNEDRAWGT